MNRVIVAMSSQVVFESLISRISAQTLNTTMHEIAEHRPRH